MEVKNHPYNLSKCSIEVFESLYNEFKVNVYAIALSILKDNKLAEDVLQETFIKLYLHLKSNEINNVKAWLISVSRNTALDLYRKRVHEICIFNEDYMNNIEVVFNDPVDKIVLFTCLKTLDDLERQIVVLKAVSGLKHREISKIVDMPLGTVLWKYRNAIKKLRRNLELYK